MATTTADTRVRTLGLICTGSGLLMTLLSLTSLWRDDSVPPTQWSYPQSPEVFLAVSVALAVAHLMSAGGYWGMHLAGAATSRPGTVGLVAAAVASLGLSGCELLNGLLGAHDTKAAAVTLVSSLFGIVSILFAGAAILAGVTLLRTGSNSTLGWLVLLTGLAIIFLVTPANISGNLTFRQLSLLVWSLLFIPLGLKVAKL